MRTSKSTRLAITTVGLVGLVGLGGAVLVACGGDDEPREYSKTEFCGIAEEIDEKYPVIDGSPSQARAAAPQFEELADAAPEDLADDAEVYYKFLAANGISDIGAMDELAEEIQPAAEHVTTFLYDECSVGTTTTVAPETTLPPDTTLPADTTLAPDSPPSS